MEKDYCVKGLSKIQIEQSALDFLMAYAPRTLKDDADPLDLERMLDTAISLHSGYTLELVEDEKIENDIEAKTRFSELTIQFRGSDFDKLHEPSRVRFTAGHELGHAVLHTAELRPLHQDSHDDDGIVIYRQKDDIPIFKRADWQAETFASALLMPVNTAINFYRKLNSEGYHLGAIIEEFQHKYMVTWSAARVRVNMIMSYIEKGKSGELSEYIEQKLRSSNSNC